MTDNRFRTLGHTIHNWLEKVKRAIYSALPHRTSVERGLVARLFGATLLRRELWSFKAEALARGLALGLFVAFTPTIGLQMLIVCLLILLFPGNLPIALAACWLTNPFTAPPIYFLEYEIGRWIVATTGAVPYQPIGENPAISGVYNVAGAMWLGSLIVGLAAGATGYIVTHALIALERKLRLSKIVYLRQLSRSAGGLDHEETKQKSASSKSPPHKPANRT